MLYGTDRLDGEERQLASILASLALLRKFDFPLCYKSNVAEPPPLAASLLRRDGELKEKDTRMSGPVREEDIVSLCSPSPPSCYTVQTVWTAKRGNLHRFSLRSPCSASLIFRFATNQTLPNRRRWRRVCFDETVVKTKTPSEWMVLLFW